MSDLKEKRKMKEVGIMVTGGAVSVPLLNIAVQYIAKAVRRNGGIPIGFSGGFYPLLGSKGIDPFEITDDMFCSGDSLLITERILPRRSQADWLEIQRQIVDVHGVSRLILIGGNGTASAIGQVRKHCPKIEMIIQVLKTMDGDFMSPYACLGFASAVSKSVEEISAFKRESTLYGSPFIVRVLGRDVGQLALNAGLQAGPRCSNEKATPRATVITY